MTFGGNGIDRSGRGERLLPAFVLTAMLVFAISTSVSAQMFTDHPPPVPPASVPDPGSAISLAPPSGPASIPSLPAPLTQPSVAAGRVDARAGRAVAHRTLRQGFAGHYQRIGMAGVFGPAGRDRYIQIDPRGTRRDAQHRAAAGELRRPCRPRTGQRGARGDAEIRD